MATDQPAPGLPAVPAIDLIGVVLVVDTSFTVKDEWQYVLQRYVSPILTRLSEVHSQQTNQFRVAFVSYATANTIPEPILARRFFGPPALLLSEFHNLSQELFLGETVKASGGMAVLEGLVAALEMCDVFLETLHAVPLHSRSLNTPYTAPGTRPPACHIIHIAGGPPDTSENPMFNTSPAYDAATLASLPAELRKRNIHYSAILLREAPQLVEFHAAASNGPQCKPWFASHPQHNILLSGFPEAPAKRAETEPTKAVGQTAPAPNLNPVPAATLASGTDVAAITNSNPNVASDQPAQPLPPPRLVAQGQPLKLPVALTPQIIARFKAMEAEVKTRLARGKQLQSEGRTQEAQALHEDSKAMIAQYYTIRAGMVQHLKAAQMQSLQNQGQAQGQTSADSNPSGNQQSIVQQSPATAPAAPISTTGSVPVPASIPAPALAPGPAPAPVPVPASAPSLEPHAGSGPHSLHRRTPSNSQLHAPASSVPGGSPVPTVNSQMMAAQMQKMLEYRQAAASQNVSTANNMAPAAGPAQLDASKSWQGVLAWTGMDGQTKKEVQAEVLAVTTSSNMRPDIWPQRMALTPAPFKPVIPQVLQSWIKNTGAVIVNLRPSARTTDRNVNDVSFRSLIQMLMEKNLYAQAAWQLPNGMVSNNILIFPFTTKDTGPNLLGAAFPETGLPAPPKNPELFNDLSKLPPEMLKRLSQMSEQQRRELLMNFDKQRQYLTAQNRTLQQPVSQDPAARAAAMMNQLQMQHQQQQQQQQQQAAAAAAAATSNFTMQQNAVAGPSTGAMPQMRPNGGVGNPAMLNHDIMQAFMQRGGTGLP